MANLYHRIYLEMSAGISFREALLDYLRSEDSLFSKKLDEVVKMASLGVQLSPNSHPNLVQISNEICELLGTHHKAQSWVKILRRDYQMRESFRQRSRMASSQALTQMVLAGFLYVLFLIFTLSRLGGEGTSYIILSIILFIIGIITAYYLTREPQWKV